MSWVPGVSPQGASLFLESIHLGRDCQHPGHTRLLVRCRGLQQGGEAGRGEGLQSSRG